MTLIGDNVRRSCVALVSDPSRAELAAIRKSFIPTAEAREFCSRVAALIASNPNVQSRPLLLTGEPGTGKTHLVRYVEGLLACPQDPAWKAIQAPAPDPNRQYPTLYLRVPEEPSIDLASFLIESVKKGGNAGAIPPESHRISAEELTAAIKRIASASVPRFFTLIAMDGVSRRMARLVDDARIRGEMDLCRAAAEALAQCGTLAVIIADEEYLHRAPERSPAPALLGSLRSVCDTIRISRKQVEEVISSALAAKDNPQRAEVQRILKQLSARLPRLTSKLETFVDLYPIHPQAFSIMFPLRGVLPQFSPLAFAQAAIESACSLSGAQLITHETLFDFVLPELRNCPECIPFLRSYDELCSAAIARMSPSLKIKARALLKGIALETICGVKPASVRALANALLLYDEAQPLPGHSLAAAVLMEMEEQGRSFLSGEGEGYNRTYQLVGQQMYAISSALPGQNVQRDDLRLRLPQLIYDWFRVNIPSWRPNPSPRYWRTSLTLLERIPEGRDRSVGMVHFKNIADPFWSRDDLTNLQGSPHRWILLVLSPFEHFYEFDPEIDAIAASSPKIIVWHPDIPTPDEAEKLRRLTVDFAWPPAAAGLEGDEPRRAHAAQAILTALYVERGRLITNQGQWPLGKEIGEQPLAHYLSAHLAATASKTPDAAGRSGETLRGSSIATQGEEPDALHWAALLSGEDDLRHLDLQSAETRIISWWTSSLEIEASTLAAKLTPLPVSLMTTHFWGEYRQFVRHLELLQPTLHLLRMGAVSFSEAMAQIRLHFKRDERLLLRWKDLIGELGGLARWLPAFEHKRDYVCGAFYTSMRQADELRTRLLELIGQPHHFLGAANRDAFDRSFLEFKTQYTDCYYARHEEAMGITAEEKGARLKVDSDALRNLELLSRLHFADRSYVTRVRLIARWLHRNRCPLPVRQILDRHPRCFCNFNPAADPRLSTAADRINSLVQGGIEYYRTIFRRFRDPVIEELKSMRVEQACAQQIAPLLGTGGMLPLSVRAVEVLNRIIQKNPEAFKTAFLSRPS
jgi:hypothetical protein